MFKIGRILLFLVLVTTFFLGNLYVEAQEETASLYTSYVSPLRTAPRTDSPALRWLDPGQEVAYKGFVTGEHVEAYGASSNTWFLVTTAQGENGYIWSKLLTSKVPPPAQYNTSITQNTNYRQLEITKTLFFSKYGLVYIQDPEELLDQLDLILGKSIWVSYGGYGGYLLPPDAVPTIQIQLLVTSNIVTGTITLPDDHVNTYTDYIVAPDEIIIQFFSSKLSGESYVMLFRSAIEFCTADHLHCATHLFGIYAIQSSDVEWLINQNY